MRRNAMLRELYAAFNARDIEAVVSAMTPDVDWPNGWEGGHVLGREMVRDSWLREWIAIHPTVEPTEISERAHARLR